MNKTLLNFTATALLSTLLTHPLMVVAVGDTQRNNVLELENRGIVTAALSNSSTQSAEGGESHLLGSTVIDAGAEFRFYGVGNQDSTFARLVQQNPQEYQATQKFVLTLSGHHNRPISLYPEGLEERQSLTQNERQNSLGGEDSVDRGNAVQQPLLDSGSPAASVEPSSADLNAAEEGRASTAGEVQKNHCCRNALIGAGVSAVALGGAGLAYWLWPSDENDMQSDEPGTALATLEANVTTAASTLTTLATTVITPLALPLLTTVKSLLTSTEVPSTLPQGIDSSMTPELLDALTIEEATSTSTSTTTPKPKKRRGRKKNRIVNTTTASTSTPEPTTTPELTTRTTTTTPAPKTASTSTTELTTTPELTTRTTTTTPAPKTASTSTTELTTTPEQTTRTTTTTVAPTTASTSTTEPTTTTEEVTSTSTSTPESTTTLAHTTASTSTTKFVEGNQNPSSQVPQCMATFHTQWMQSVQQNRDDFLAQCQQVINQNQLVQCTWQYHQKVQPYMQQYNEHLQPCIKKYSMQLMQKISSNNSGRLPEKDLQTIQQSNQQKINEACQRIEQKLSSHVQQWNGSINNRYANSYNAQQFVEDMRQYSQTLLKEITDDFTQLTRNMWTHNDGQLIAYRTAYQQQQAVQRRLQQEAAQSRQQHDVNNVSESERARHNEQVLAQYRRQHNAQQIQSWQQATDLANQDYYQQAHVSNTGHNAVAPNYDYVDNQFYCYYPTGYTYVYHNNGWIDAFHPDGNVYRKAPDSNIFEWFYRYS